VTDPHNLVELAMRVAQLVDDDGDTLQIIPPPPLPTAQEGAGLTRTALAKEKKAAHELAAMILNDLSQIEGCPERGVKVVVYGSNPWNSWLSFSGAAGRVPNKVELQSFCDIITERLKRLYDVSS
jgi:hypothetical protein